MFNESNYKEARQLTMTAQGLLAEEKVQVFTRSETDCGYCDFKTEFLVRPMLALRWLDGVCIVVNI